MDDYRIKLQQEINCMGIEKYVKSLLGIEHILMKGDPILKQNEKDSLKQRYENSWCQFTECTEKAIKSHIYPNTFLKSIMGNEAKWIDLADIISTSNSFGGIKLISDVRTKATTYPLFCKKHDFEIFKRIETEKSNIDLESYLYLYSYRFFVCEYFTETFVYYPIYKLYSDKDYSNKLNEMNQEYKEKYLLSKLENSFYAEKRYPLCNFQSVKKDFDKIFKNNKTPNKEDFKKYFSIKYFKIDCSIDFLAFGCTAFSKDSIDGHLPSIYSLIPSRDNKALYFTIVIPNSEVETMNVLINFFEEEYKKFKKKDKNYFLINMETRLIECSENLLFSTKLYKHLLDNNLLDDFDIAYNILILSRLLGKPEYLCNAASYIEKLNLIIPT